MALVMTGDGDASANALKGRTAQTDNADTEVIAAQGSQQLLVDAISIVNTSVTATYVDILSGGVVIWTVAAPASGGQSNVSFPRPLPGVQAKNISARVAVGVSTCYISILARALPSIIPNV